MKLLRHLMVSLLAAALLLTVSSLSSVPVVTAQKQKSAHPKKPAGLHYVCPMHENVTSKKPGTCPKCKMKLVKKPLPQQPS